MPGMSSRTAHLCLCSLAILWLWSVGTASAQGLWDRLKDGAAATYEGGGALVREGAERGGDLIGQGARAGLEVGGAVVEKGVTAGREAVDDLTDHFAREGTPDEIRERVDRMALDTLDRLFEEDPEASLLFALGYGYAVFEVRQVSLTLTAGYGYGVAVAEDGFQRTYMKAVTGGLELKKGIGGGLAERWVVLFDDEQVFRRFVEEGFEATAEAAATVGAARSALAARLREGVTFYRVTAGGLKVAVVVSGTRFWPDAALNDRGVADAP